MLDGKRVLKACATPSLNLPDSPDILDESGSSLDNASGVACSGQNVEALTDEVKENCPEEDGCDSFNSSEASSPQPSCSNEEESDDVASIPPCSHDKGNLDADEGLSLEEVLNVADDAAEISSIFKKMSSHLTKDIANISNSSSCSTPMDKLQNSCSSKEESCSTQTETSQFTLLHLIHDDTQLKSFTGVTFETFNCLLELVLELHGEDDPKIPMKSRILLTLCRLRLNLSYQCLSALVGIERRICGSIFASTLHLLAVVLQHTVYWPSKEEISLNMPKCFKKYRNTRVVLDCTEVPICSPDCLKCRIRLYSHYKGCQTVKILVGVAPSGLITFISKVYGGRASEKQIFEESDLVKLLEPYIDAVMVDKGFRIDAICDELNIKIHRSLFVEKKQPLTPANARMNADIAHARVYVERVIQRMKIFKILQSKMSWAMVPYLDEIFVVIAGLVNLSPPVLADDKFMIFQNP